MLCCLKFLFCARLAAVLCRPRCDRYAVADFLTKRKRKKKKDDKDKDAGRVMNLYFLLFVSAEENDGKAFTR